MSFAKKLLIITLSLPLLATAGTFTSDFTQGVDTNYWTLWTSFPNANFYTNYIDAKGVTFQRLQDPAGNTRQSFNARLTLTGANFKKITTGGYLADDFSVSMTYTNLNHLLSAAGDFFTWANNQVKLYLQWGDGGAPERVHPQAIANAFTASAPHRTETTPVSAETQFPHPLLYRHPFTPNGSLNTASLPATVTYNSPLKKCAFVTSLPPAS